MFEEFECCPPLSSYEATRETASSPVAAAAVDMSEREEMRDGWGAYFRDIFKGFSKNVASLCGQSLCRLTERGFRGSDRQGCI